jgi:hypothetical protein
LKIWSHGKAVSITNAKIKEIAATLGIYLGGMYWFSVPIKEDDGSELIYKSKEVGKDSASFGKMIAHLRTNHFTFNNTFLFKRAYCYEKYGDELKRAQKIVCFDIDGHKGEDTKTAVKFLASMFDEIKYIEYSGNSKSYHVYIEFERPVLDYALNNLRDYFLAKGYNIDPITSDEHMRFPFSMNYSNYGGYDPNEDLLIQRTDIDTLLVFWKIYQPAIFDPTFEAVFPEPKNNKIKKRGSGRINNLKQKMIDNPEHDYGAGERHNKVISILGYCLKYHLSEEDYTDICVAHNKGARGKTDYHNLYNWGLTHFEGASAPTEKADYSALIERVYHYTKIAALSEGISVRLETVMDKKLVTFLKGRANICPTGSFKNEKLVRARYGKHVKTLLLFLCQYIDAKDAEIHAMVDHSANLILPLMFQHTNKGIPMPLGFIKFLGKHFKCGSFHEAKVFLESIGWLKAIPLNDRGATYAEGRAIYYELGFGLKKR